MTDHGTNVQAVAAAGLQKLSLADGVAVVRASDAADLVGVPNRLAVQDIGAGMAFLWIAVAAPDFSSQRLRAYDLMSKQLWADPVTSLAQTITDVMPCPTGEVVVCDSTTNATGLRVYDGTTESTTAALATGVSFCSAHGLVCY